MAFCDIDAVAYVNATIRGFWYQNGMPLDVPQGAYTHHRTLLMSAHACKNKQSHGWKTPLWPSETWSLLSFAFSCAIRALLGRDGMYIYGKVAEPIRAWQWLIVVLAGRKKNCYQSVKICQTFLQSCMRPTSPSYIVLFARRCWCLYFDMARTVGTSGGAAPWLNYYVLVGLASWVHLTAIDCARR